MTPADDRRPTQAAGSLRLASAAFAVALVALVWALLHLAWYPHGQIVDYGVYRHYGDSIVHQGAVPYRDFRLEYPPGALPVFALPAALERFDFRRVFQVEMAVCLLTITLSVWWLRGRAAATAAAVAPLLLGSVVLSRFDLWPAALAALALGLVVHGRTRSSGLVLGTAFAAKLWPAVLAPFVVLWLWRTRGRRAAAEWSAAALAAAAAWFLPFVALSPAGVGHSFYAQLARPLQIESLGAEILIASHHAFGTAIGRNDSFGSQNVAGHGAAAVASITTAAEAAAIVAVFVLFARGRPTVERLLVASAGTVAALLAFGKVFSPQFLIWLIPLVPLVRSVAARALFAAALILTQLYFPRRYWELPIELRRSISTLVLVRDLLVVAILAVLLYALHRSRAESSSASSSVVSARSGARTAT